MLSMRFGKNELIHLSISVLTITLAFWILLSRKGLGVLSSLDSGTGLLAVFVAVGLGFVIHEIGHKAVAERFGCTTAYRAWMPGLVLALAFAAFTPFIFAAPGAVYIHKRYLSVRENGIISLSGPLMNTLLGFVFLLIFLEVGGLSLLGFIALFGFQINFFLALFNLLPFPPLDGYKVFNWSALVWGAMFVTLIYFNFFFPVGLFGF